VAHTQLRWQDPDSREPREAGADVGVADLAPALAESSPRLQVSYTAAFFAEQLRGSPYGWQVSAQDLARTARDAAERTEDGDVRELAELIARAA
jgi:Ca-activated chloride channel family protein